MEDQDAGQSTLPQGSGTAGATADPRRVHEFRVGWVWTEIRPEPIRSLAAVGLFGDVATKTRHTAVYANASIAGGAWQLPWSRPDERHESHFWNYYLGANTSRDISAPLAWAAIAPLVARPKDFPRPVAPSFPGAMVMTRLFIYPFAFAVCTIVRVVGERTIPEMLRDIAAIKSSSLFGAGDGKGKTTLPQLGSDLMARARRAALGADPAELGRSLTPFTVAAVVETNQWLSSNNEEETLRMLDAMCTNLKQPNSAVPLATLQKRRIPIANEPSAMMYGLDRARAFMLAHSCGPKEHPAEVRTSSGCYHRNLCGLAMQVDALAGFLTLAAPLSQVTSALAPLQAEAKSRLGSLAKAAHGTYRNHSAIRHVADNLYDKLIGP